MSTSKRTKRKTVTFDPAEDVAKTLIKACKDANGRTIRGMRTHLINDALRRFLQKRGMVTS